MTQSFVDGLISSILMKDIAANTLNRKRITRLKFINILLANPIQRFRLLIIVVWALGFKKKIGICSTRPLPMPREENIKP